MKFLDKLNKIPIWQKLLALVVIAAIEVFLFKQQQWNRLDEEFGSLQRSHAELDRRYREQKAIADDLANFQANIRRLEEDLRIALTQLPKEKEIPTLLRDIYTLGKKSGVDFKVFQPGGEQPKKLYAEVPIKLQLTGNYHEVAVFFDRIGKLSRIVNISDIDLAQSAGKDPNVQMLNVNCTATTFMFLGGS